ncbi:2-C-methyl-D-erythritol 4-phosphate cytidylyltransferase [Isobaculum melis]|uniref:2-C-methyl-D-erythritol 4-phosphate cytidylyltransferase n=1 Tax=Isobaculum melis TaxID=142588 RepID=A0A1H9SHB3_9LACT|nr:2-C-methyl-D-erythritol 4-phosphate cytidylyltransferase [Isobaculum melis]SER84367.1 2-C-methyl-D-erythritol 4-phosphate cytidylyltransferase [Isobaculum melis]
MEYELILLAAGQGKRMNASKNKVLLHLLGEHVIEYALNLFVSDANCKQIILVAKAAECEELQQMIAKNKHYRVAPIKVVAGGDERQDSVYNGLYHVQDPSRIVMIHDGARPFIEQEFVQRLYQKAIETGAAILGVPVKDTIKKVENGVVVETVSREHLWQIQTPQAFQFDLIMKAHQKAKMDGFFGTDDASLVEYYGAPVYMVGGSYDNIKLTTPDDMVIAEAILSQRKKWRGRK